MSPNIWGAFSRLRWAGDSVWVAMDVVEGVVTMRASVWMETATEGATQVLIPFSTNVWVCDAAMNVLRFVWVDTDVVVVFGGSVWVPALSRTALGTKHCCPWPADVHLLCSSYSPITIPFP